MLNFQRAAHRFPCDSPLCGCPSASGRGNYTFRYVSLPLVYFDVPKAASTSIRRAFFGKSEACSLISPGLRCGNQFRFSFVRNPWARAVSNWRMFTTVEFGKKVLISLGGSGDFSFHDFLLFTQTRNNHHWLPQSLYVPRRLDFLGRLENYAEDFQRVQSVALENGVIEAEMEPPHLNQLEGQHYSEYYSDKERAMVAKIYRDDIERFGYEF